MNGSGGGQTCVRLCKAVTGGGAPRSSNEGICTHYTRDPPGVGECQPPATPEASALLAVMNDDAHEGLCVRHIVHPDDGATPMHRSALHAPTQPAPPSVHTQSTRSCQSTCGPGHSRLGGPPASTSPHDTHVVAPPLPCIPPKPLPPPKAPPAPESPPRPLDPPNPPKPLEPPDPPKPTEAAMALAPEPSKELNPCARHGARPAAEALPAVAGEIDRVAAVEIAVELARAVDLGDGSLPAALLVAEARAPRRTREKAQRLRLGGASALLRELAARDRDAGRLAAAADLERQEQDGHPPPDLGPVKPRAHVKPSTKVALAGVEKASLACAAGGSTSQPPWASDPSRARC